MKFQPLAILSLFLISHGHLQAESVTAKKAEAFIHSIGVCLHMGYDNPGGAYTNFPMVKQRLIEIGIRHYRDGFDGPKSKGWVKRFFNELAREGIRGTFVTQAKVSMEDTIAAANIIPDAIEAFEGQNEILNIYVKWDDKKRDAARKHQKDLYRSLNADPKWKNTPIIGPSCVGIKAYQALGDLSAYMDFGAVHPYPIGASPAEEKSGLHHELEEAKLVAGNLKLFATETGYTTGSSDYGNQRISNKAAGKYAPRLYLENFNRGIICSFWYELCDQGTNGSQEATFGLITKSHECKPQGTAIKNLITLLKDASFDKSSKSWKSPEFVPGKLDFTIIGGSKDIHTTLLQKSNGSFYLCIWNEIRSYDFRNNKEQDIENPEVPVVIRVGKPITKVNAYRPTNGTAATAMEFVKGELALTIPDEVVILEIPQNR